MGLDRPNQASFIFCVCIAIMPALVSASSVGLSADRATVAAHAPLFSSIASRSAWDDSPDAALLDVSSGQSVPHRSAPLRASRERSTRFPAVESACREVGGPAAAQDWRRGSRGGDGMHEQCDIAAGVSMIPAARMVGSRRRAEGGWKETVSL